jgi:hypothetical protein
MTSLTVMDSIVFVETLLKNQRLSVNGYRPGMTMANNVLGWMLAPPFIWRFNRGSFVIPISESQGTDYNVFWPDLGRIENQWLTDDTGAIFDLKGAQTMSKFSTSRRALEVAPVYDDNQGNLTFRFNSIPAKNLYANFDYQKKPQRLTSPASTFAPFPDEYSYLFDKGMLSEGALLINDSRFEIWRKDFGLGILATQDGLDAQAKEIFMNQLLGRATTATRAQYLAQQGAQGRQQ